MEKTLNTNRGRGPGGAPEKKGRRLPAFARWLIGWAAVLAAAGGLSYYWRVVFALPAAFALPVTLAALCLASLLYGLLFLFTRLAGDALPLQTALAVFSLGLLFCFATAPLQAPDETGYFLRANEISRGVFVYRYETEYPADVSALTEAFAPPMNHNLRYAGGLLAPAAVARYTALAEENKAPEKTRGSIVFLTLEFLPMAAFIALARLFGFAALGQLYAARMANLLVYAVLCYFAVKNAGRLRGVFVAFALLPLSLFLAASCSYDGPMLALCLFAASFFGKAKLALPDAAAFTAALALANRIKPLNFILVFLLLLLPRKSWRLKVKPWAACLAALIAVLGVWFLTDRLNRQLSYIGGWPAPDQIARGSGDAAAPAGQLAFMLQNPLRFAAVALQSLLEANGFLFDLGRLGHMDMPLPPVSGASLFALGAAAVLEARPGEEASRRVSFGLLGLALVYSAALLAGLYVTDTDLASIRITGLQPRYFIPALLLLFMLAALLLGRVPNLRAKARPEAGGGLAQGGAAAARAERLCLCIAGGVALLAAVLVFQNYFVGQWLPKAEGGWQMVNFLGWQVR